MRKPRYPVVTVTAADIAKGRPADCERCPIARAVARTLALPRRLRVRVLPPEHNDHAVLTIVRGGDVRTLHAAYHVPKKAGVFTVRFDTTEGAKPFTFALRPYPLAKLMPELPL